MVLGIRLHNRSKPDFFDFLRGHWGGVPLEIFESSYPYEISKLRVIIPDINLHNRSELDFSSQEALWGRASWNLQNQFTALSIGPIVLKLGRIIKETSTNDVRIDCGWPRVRTKCGQSELNRMRTSKKLKFISSLKTQVQASQMPLVAHTFSSNVIILFFLSISTQ